MKLPGLAKFRLCTLATDELCEKVADALHQMYESGNLPARHIPARPNGDFDLMVAELIVRVKQLSDKPTD